MIAAKMRFNSKMVRFKAYYVPRTNPPQNVSIPKWYDLKLYVRISVGERRVFQFQNGTI